MHRLVSSLTLPIITDGAWATRLQEAGLPINTRPDLWNLTHPDAVARVASGYVEAGSRIILTNTFGANRVVLSRSGSASKLREINREGVLISKRAAGNAVLVFGSMGPCTTTRHAASEMKREVSESFREQAECLAEAGADGLVLETMFDLEEALMALSAAKQTGLLVVASLACYGAPGSVGLDGLEAAAAALADGGADGIGANCGEGPRSMLSVCERLRAASSLPIWIKPNAGLPRFERGRAVYALTPKLFAEEACALVSAGADFIGGCCGTGPQHIVALRNCLEPGTRS